MASKIKKFDKVINDNLVAMEIYTKQQNLHIQIAELEKQEKSHLSNYVKMEGMYALDTAIDPWAGQGMRGYYYVYPNEDIKKKECTERQTYYTTNITPLKQKIEELRKQVWTLEESLCIALWGYGREEYYIQTKLTRAKKELAEQIVYIEKLQNELKEIKKRG